jgi:hypothetical protein
MRNLLLGSFVGLLVGALGFVGLRAAGLVGAPAPAVEVPPPPAPAPVEPEPFAARAVAAEKERLNPVYEDVLYVRGYVARGHRVNVLLSDGSVISEDVKELRTVSRTHVELAGKRYALRCFVPVSEAAPGQPAGNGQRADVAGESEQVSPVSAPSASERAGMADEGAWARGPDGVARLKEKQTIGR